MGIEEIKSNGDQNDSVNSANDLAFERTVMAADRTLMAWVRTGLSLISFGFTIYKFLEYTGERLASSGKMVDTVSSPRLTGLILIGMGILSMIFGTIENAQILKGLQGQYQSGRPRYSLIISGLVTMLGILLFAGIILQLKGIG